MSSILGELLTRVRSVPLLLPFGQPVQSSPPWRRREARRGPYPKPAPWPKPAAPIPGERKLLGSGDFDLFENQRWSENEEFRARMMDKGRDRVAPIKTYGDLGAKALTGVPSNVQLKDGEIVTPILSYSAPPLGAYGELPRPEPREEEMRQTNDPYVSNIAHQLSQLSNVYRRDSLRGNLVLRRPGEEKPRIPTFQTGKSPIKTF